MGVLPWFRVLGDSECKINPSTTGMHEPFYIIFFSEGGYGVKSFRDAFCYLDIQTKMMVIVFSLEMNLVNCGLF